MVIEPRGKRSPKKKLLSTDKRLTAFATDDSDNGMVELYYQFGRYLTIAGSRPGSIPTNLQGIWKSPCATTVGSSYTLKYQHRNELLAKRTDRSARVSSTTARLLPQVAVNGSKTAKINYGIDNGWTAHHNSDIWAMAYPFRADTIGTEPIFTAVTCWPMAGSWFAQHL